MKEEKNTSNSRFSYIKVALQTKTGLQYFAFLILSFASVFVVAHFVRKNGKQSYMMYPVMACVFAVQLLNDYIKRVKEALQRIRSNEEQKAKAEQRKAQAKPLHQPQNQRKKRKKKRK
ncbi:MAG: hypothetical protein FWG10_04950 [Eubacteriaceae bacterium]|nr:hypothetical protein [Eubacteriaceae bacterium]